MKNILFATTALVATAGIASADVTFSGTGEAGIYRTEKADGSVKATGYANMATAIADLGSAATLGDVTAELALAAASGSGTLATQAEVDAAHKAVATAEKALAAAMANGYDEATIAKLAYDVEEKTLIAAAMGTASAATGDMTAYSGYQADVTLSAETDSGITFSMGFDLEAGLMADKDDDREMDDKTGSIANSTLTMAANGYTLVIGQDEIDDLYDDTQNGDISLSGEMNGLSFTVVHDFEDSVAAVAAVANQYTTTAAAADATNTRGEITSYVAGSDAVAADNNGTSVKLGYTMGAATLGLVATSANDRDNSANKISLGYTVSDALSFSVAHDSQGKRDAITSASVTYAMDALTFKVSYADDKNHAGNTNKDGKASTNLSVAYAQGPVSATFATDESSAWWINANYDLGGGASAFATVDHQEFAVAGLSFAF